MSHRSTKVAHWADTPALDYSQGRVQRSSLFECSQNLFQQNLGPVRRRWGRRWRRFGSFETIHEPDDQKEDECDDQKINRCLQKCTYFNGPNLQFLEGGVAPPRHIDDRHQDMIYQRGHNFAKSTANDHTNRKVEDVALQGKCFEFLNETHGFYFEYRQYIDNQRKKAYSFRIPQTDYHGQIDGNVGTLQKLRQLRNHWINWMLFILLCITWGSSFVIMKEGLKLLSPWQVASVRIISAGLVLIPFGWQSFRRIPRDRWGLIFLSGLLGTFFPAFLFCIAETRIDSSLAGIMNALTPIFTLLIGVTIFAQQIPLMKWVGVGIGFVGLVFLILSGDQGISLSHTGYASFVLLATLFYGINVQMVNRYMKDIPSRDIATIAFTLLVIPAALILAITGFFSAPVTVIYSSSTLASALLGVIGTAVASIVFYMLLKRAGPLFASMVTYGIPFVALFWGLVAGESINQWQVLGLCTILVGVFLANKK